MTLAGAVAFFALGAAAPAQTLPRRDSTGADTLARVVVTAERAPAAIATVSSAVTRLSAAELARVPTATLADLLRLAPGVALVNFDGLGHDPQLMVRGFYGGGEAEYVIVLVDGKTVGQFQTGLVAWDALPALSSIEAVEVVRGSASAFYGDAAVAAVINIITVDAALRGDARRSFRWSLEGGAFGSIGGSTGLSARRGSRDVSLFFGADRTDGFRSHAERVASSGRMNIDLSRSARRRVALSSLWHWRKFDEPGPLLDSLLAADRAASDPLFRFDHTLDRSVSFGLDDGFLVGATARIVTALRTEARHTSSTRTLALAPGFGDTKARIASTVRSSASLQWNVDDTPLPGADRFTVGTEVSRGELESRYRNVLTGDRDAYRAARGEQRDISASGHASRAAAAAFAHYALQATPALRASLGARLDWLSDGFDPSAPSQGDRLTAAHTALSPKAGLSIRYLQSDRASGHAYLTASQSFKAPTLDQLFDQRAIPIPLPPFTVTTSNAELDPQRGTSVEGGVYHNAVLRGTLRAAATLSVYQMNMKDELDFDIQTFRYVNIGRSRHRGVEAGLTLAAPGAVSAFANYTLQAATSRSGQFAGKYLKAIPRHVVSGGFSVAPRSALDAGVIVTHSRDMSLDDANSRALPPYTRADAQLGYRFHAVRLDLETRNLLDARYSTTGYLDPGGTGRAYFYPAAGRVIAIGFRSAW